MAAGIVDDIPASALFLMLSLVIGEQYLREVVRVLPALSAGRFQDEGANLIHHLARVDGQSPAIRNKPVGLWHGGISSGLDLLFFGAFLDVLAQPLPLLRAQL